MSLDGSRLSLASARRPRASEVWAVVLAAGASRRMGRSKALHPLRGGSFLGRILQLYHRLRLPTCVVLGPRSERAEEEAARARALVLHNPEPERGPLSSLQAALGRLGGVSAVVVHPVDHPLVDLSSIKQLVVMHRRNPASILIPSCHEVKGHPVLFPSRFIPDLRQAPLAVGARWVVHRNQSATLLVRVRDRGVLANLNTPGEFDYWSKRADPGFAT